MKLYTFGCNEREGLRAGRFDIKSKYKLKSIRYTSWQGMLNSPYQAGRELKTSKFILHLLVSK